MLNRDAVVPAIHIDKCPNCQYEYPVKRQIRFASAFKRNDTLIYVYADKCYACDKYIRIERFN